MDIQDREIHEERRYSPLVLEEDSLGAEYKRYGHLYLPAVYRDLEDELSAGQIALCDYSCLSMISLSGNLARKLCDSIVFDLEREKSLTSSDAIKLKAGLILTTDHMVSELVLRIDMGENQQMLLCSLSNKEELLEGFKEQLAVEPYNLVIGDESSKLCTLALYGSGEELEDLLKDYLSEEQDYPKPFELKALNLDEIPAMVYRLKIGQPKELLLVQVSFDQAARLWRSLLSFEQLIPWGIERFDSALEGDLPALSMLKEARLYTKDELKL